MGKSRYRMFKEEDIGTKWWFNHDVPDLPDITYHRTIQGKEDLLFSQGNPVWKLGKAAFVGGNFHLIKHELVVDSSIDIGSQLDGGGFQHYVGKNYACGSISIDDWPIIPVTNDSELDAWGTSVIASVEPTNPVSNLFGFLGELKNDGLPSVVGVPTWQGRTKLAKSAGSEYLNAEFGWIPLISDIRSFAHAVTNSDELIAQYSRNSGRKIKRNFTLPVETDTETSIDDTAVYDMYPLGGPVFCTGNARRTVITTTKKQKWFSGCFTYYLPPLDPGGNNSKRNRLIAEKLFGSRVTPELVWDLTPWTWAVDWMGNFGDVLHNVGAFANTGLVMQYGYVMEQKSIERATTISNIEFKSLPGAKFSCTTTLKTISKRRRAATPYGFGLDVGSFTPQQTAILVALGFSRT